MSHPVASSSQDFATEACAPSFQHTVGTAACCTGVGLHSGQKISLKILPAEPDSGITFFRTDLVNGARTVHARWDNVVDTRLCTMIGNDHGGKVGTIEHLMAALRAAEIDNALIELDGGEVPIMDGSADAFLSLIEMAGIQEQKALRKEIVILKPVEITLDGKKAALLPAEQARYTVGIQFPHKIIQAQNYDFTLTQGGFKKQIARARTFGFYEEIEALQKMGLGKGGSLDNAIVIKGDGIMNEDGLRFENEFVRHKLLDAIGDLALAGAPIRGHFQGDRTGHALNNQLLRALFADETAYVLR